MSKHDEHDWGGINSTCPLAMSKPWPKHDNHVWGGINSWISVGFRLGHIFKNIGRATLGY
jgi:hypothetical protein